MKSTLNELIRSEKGQVVIIVLGLLVIGGLTIAPALGHISTGLNACRLHEKKMYEKYAADSGVEDALWHLTYDNLTVPAGGNVTLPIFTMNDKTVNVSITDAGSPVYRIVSVATSAEGSITTIQSEVKPISFFDNAITCNGDITVKPKSTVCGRVQYGGTLSCNGTINGTVVNEIYKKWPAPVTLSSYYWGDVKHLIPYPNGTIDIINNPTIGPLYRNGDLIIRNTGPPATLTLQGTIYVTGNLLFAQPGAGRDYTVDLNGHSIYVEGSIAFKPHHVGIAGSGTIIAVGDVTFEPNVNGNPTDFVFVMSVTSTVLFHPASDFYGSVAANVTVHLEPDSSLIWRDPAGIGLNFPIESVQTLGIRTWQIT